MNKYLTEFIGTFFLVLTIGCTLLTREPGIIPPMAIGAMLMVMVFAGGHISGAHYNPAVTLAVFLRGKLPMSDVVPYMTAQLIGAVTAALVVGFLAGSGTPMEIANVPAALLAEFLFTFALCWVVLNVATSRDTAGNSFYGLAIGMTVMTGGFAVARISGAAFNPAVAIGAGMMKLVAFQSLWIHLLSEFAAAAAAAMTFKVLSKEA